MPGPTTIAEALESLPSSSAFPPTASSTSQSLPKNRRILLAPKKHPQSTSSSSKTPPLKWVPSHPQHLLSPASSSSGITVSRHKRVKETILIKGRDPGVKQSLKFKSRLPLPFLEQNGPHDEDLMKDFDDDGGGLVGEGGGGEREAEDEPGFTASDLEMDMETDPSDAQGAGMTIDLLEAPLPSFASSPPTKRRRISKRHEETQDMYDSLPNDFLALLKAEVPGGRKDVSPGDFARVWKMSGRQMGNELVLAQNEYFDKMKEGKRKGRKGGR